MPESYHFAAVPFVKRFPGFGRHPSRQESVDQNQLCSKQILFSVKIRRMWPPSAQSSDFWRTRTSLKILHWESFQQQKPGTKWPLQRWCLLCLWKWSLQRGVQMSIVYWKFSSFFLKHSKAFQTIPHHVNSHTSFLQQRWVWMISCKSTAIRLAVCTNVPVKSLLKISKCMMY